jgi:hypothetical protein
LSELNGIWNVMPVMRDVIRTGQNHSLQPANAKSVPGSLGLLAFGAQRLDAWRTQRMPKRN